MEEKISQLVEYAVRNEWLTEEDRIWAANRLLEVLQQSFFSGLVPVKEIPPIEEILQWLCEYAYEHGVIEGRSAAYFDLFDTKLMGCLIPRPSEIISGFQERYEEGPRKATDWYYSFSQATNYIRTYRIKKDRKWTVDTEYGTLDITINLSKPEKDPKAIEAAAKEKSSGYPSCLLCRENEGYAGHLNHPARQNHRVIPVVLNEMDYYMQYSPYVYYNEHCIVFQEKHVPMKIDRNTFDHLLDFVTIFPHYFIGSNADLPIVGGSVLSHDHYQGGHFEFAMARAEVEQEFVLKGYEDLRAGIVKWPMSVIRLNGADRERVAAAAERILKSWCSYDDPEAFIFHETDGVRHSTITPIARRRGDLYELDLVLRNNITTPEHPLGVYHPHAEKHHIKKENIGLIEVMGLAVLPARLKKELEAVAEGILAGRDLKADPLTASHAEWAEKILQAEPEAAPNTIMEILERETGKVFCEVLEDAGVFKRTPVGRENFKKFIDTIAE